MKEFLKACEYIDHDHPSIIAQARLLSQTAALHIDKEEAIVKNCFEFVRDHISHSADVGNGPVTCKASDVLLYKTGYCYAKSHLLAALLRASSIPAALCYQRVTIDNNTVPFCLHGLNAVYLKQYGWYRMDARGNKPGVNSEFLPPKEQLAFAIVNAGEQDFLERFVSPLPEVITALNPNYSVEYVAEHLPDLVSLRK